MLSLLIYTPILLFYLGIVVPEYVACLGCNSEGAMGTDIWGSEIQCFGESKELGEVFFQFSTLIIIFSTVALAVVVFAIRNFKKKM